MKSSVPLVFSGRQGDRPEDAPSPILSKGLPQLLEDLSRISGLPWLWIPPGGGYPAGCSQEHPYCRYLQDLDGVQRRCQEDCGSAILEARQKHAPVYFHCWARLYSAAFPVPAGATGGEAPIVLGGRIYLSYSDFASCRDRIRKQGGATEALLDLVGSLIFRDGGFLEETVQRITRILQTVLAASPSSLSLPDRHRSSRLEALLHLARDLQEGALEPTLSVSLSSICVLYGFQGGLYLLRQEGQRNFVVSAVFGRELEDWKGRVLSGEETPLSRIWETSKPWVIQEIQAFTQFGFPEAVCWILVVPLRGREDVFGAWVLLDRDREDKDLLNELEILGGFLGSRLEKEAVRRREIFLEEGWAHLKRRLQALLGAFHEPDLYGEILEQMAGLVGATQGSLLLYNEEGRGLEVVAAKGIHRSVLQHLVQETPGQVLQRVFEQGAPLWIPGGKEDTVPPLRSRYQSPAFISLPLVVKGRTLGILNLSDPQREDGFTPEQVRMVEVASLFVAAMLEGIRHYQHSLNLRQISYTDSLTGLPNRRYFQERLREEIERSRRLGDVFSLMILDIDHFKQFNDAFGHPAGDEALRQIARWIRRCVRAIDIAARIGGEEFAVILPQAEKRAARPVGDRIRGEIEKEGIPIPGTETQAHFTVSIGIATYPMDAVTLEGLVERADRALYRAKAQGRNRVVLFQEGESEIRPS